MGTEENRGYNNSMLPLVAAVSSASAASPTGFRLGAPVLVGPGRYSAWTLAALPNPQRAAMDLLVDTTTGSRADIMRSSDGGNSWRSTAVEVSGYTCPPLVSPDPPPHHLCLTLRLTPSCRA